MINLKKLKKSFKYATKGVIIVFKEEQSFRVQVLASIVVIAAMLILGLSKAEQALITLAIVLVLVLELMNSIFERMVDMMKPRIHHYVEDIKDIMAGSVLIASIGAFLIGVLIFWPYVMAYIGN